MKICSNCRTEKPLDSFYRLEASPDGRQQPCKACSSAKQSARWLEIRASSPREHPPDTRKTCSACGAAKLLDEFGKHLKGKYERRARCKDCQSAYARQKAATEKEQVLEKACTRCGVVKPVAEYHRSAGARDGLASRCRPCVSASRSRQPAKQRKAHYLVNRAIVSGELSPQPCEVCGTEERIEAHHPDYDRPLDVMWLCARHHGEWHRTHGKAANY